MTVEYTQNGSAKIAYETFGDPSGEPLLLIMGLDFQMVYWPDDFCRTLVDRGFFVARFDNRDAGLSQHFTSVQQRHPVAALFRRDRMPAYTGADMVGDGLAVMDALGWKSAHVAGASLGGFLAVATALGHPDRVRSLALLLATPSGTRASLRYIRFGFLGKMAKIKHPDTDEGAIQTLVDISRAQSSPGNPVDVTWARQVAEIAHHRAPRDQSGTQRQLAAVRSYPGLSARRLPVSAPTIVVNGEDDPLLRGPAAARALAKAIPGATATVLPAMGHDLPAPHWSRIADAIAANAGMSHAS
ncbi:MAG: alpha/beta hydrolase [Hamadaea sp.]|uniref:alpha/beta fold hydrolase n=1 Tax=Hamadaea sp. TaxID=2024425 RepID=UPI0017D6A5F0|nr:alpha/beta hydrolase [Hamadaea sp.]NUR69417.1 alpha/beta hydrolase [Hamadaea sp.]NUT23832.1 alpha/beta hydrolase [Hamadaea sp.]